MFKFTFIKNTIIPFQLCYQYNFFKTFSWGWDYGAMETISKHRSLLNLLNYFTVLASKCACGNSLYRSEPALHPIAWTVRRAPTTNPLEAVALWRWLTTIIRYHHPQQRLPERQASKRRSKKAKANTIPAASDWSWELFKLCLNKYYWYN